MADIKANPGETNVILEVKDLKMHFPITKGFFRHVVGHVRAVDGVSFTVREGETLGLVGESGCGKQRLVGVWCGVRADCGPDSLSTGRWGSCGFDPVKGRRAKANPKRNTDDIPGSILLVESENEDKGHYRGAASQLQSMRGC